MKHVTGPFSHRLDPGFTLRHTSPTRPSLTHVPPKRKCSERETREYILRYYNVGLQGICGHCWSCGCIDRNGVWNEACHVRGTLCNSAATPTPFPDPNLNNNFSSAPCHDFRCKGQEEDWRRPISTAEVLSLSLSLPLPIYLSLSLFSSPILLRKP